jgi:N-acetylneuraminate synthase
MDFKIGKISFGRKKPPVIIGEIGINHGGSIKTAKEMVKSASKAGLKIIKHQTHIVEDEMVPIAKKTIPGNSSKSIYEIMDECALNEDEEFELFEYTKSLGLEFISTPFSRAAVERLEGFGVNGYKIGSGECNNLPLVDHIVNRGKPIILSTGMNDLISVKSTVDLIDKRVPIALLHTTNLYPTPSHLVRLGAMEDMANEFKEIPFGLSDHTTNNLSSLGAIAKGATIIERHYTDKKSRRGPDIVCSMDEKETSDLIKNSLELFSMLGGQKKAAAEEQVTINFAFSSVVTIKEIKKGDVFSKENIWVKRPGNGEISASEFDKIIGKIAKNNIPKDVQLKKNNL